MAHLPRLLVLPFLFLFLGIHVAASHGSPLPRTYDGSMCSKSWCGSVDIHYPFYLSNATRETADYTSYSCGYTDLNISCQGEEESKTPIIQLGNDSYTIKNIFYDNHTIMLADADAFRGTSCFNVSHNVTFDGELLKYTSSYDSLTFYYGCYSNPDRTVPPILDNDPHKINCAGSDGPSGRGVSFVFTSEDHGFPREYDLAGNCDRIFVAPVQRDFLTRGGPPGGYSDMLKKGFELTWNPCYQACNSSGASSASASRYFNKRRKTYIIASTLSTFLLCLLLFAFFLGHKKYRSKKISKETPRIESFLQKNGTLHPKRYTYPEVKRMTNSFAVKLGQGGFGAVYRGNLSDGRQVAAKMLKDSKGDGEEFINEVASISRTSHVNVVTLVGFCLQGPKRVLIYEYMPNGSLERYAFNNNSKGGISLTWEKLFDIAVGIARGLEYLHRGCNTRIVHFDIKPHNILLDQDFCPKISDFGMAKLCINKESIISIGGARGTIGYIAPEVYSKQFGAVSSKSDVYSYGMMVLEMVGARDKNINANSESSSQYFPQWIYEHLDEYCVSASEINGEITEIVRKMIVIGLWCIQLNPSNRPTMTGVVEMLEGSTSGLELPPKMLLS